MFRVDPDTLLALACGAPGEPCEPPAVAAGGGRPALEAGIAAFERRWAGGARLSVADAEEIRARLRRAAALYGEAEATGNPGAGP